MIKLLFALMGIALVMVLVPKYKSLCKAVFGVYFLVVIYITLLSRTASQESQGIRLFPFQFLLWIKLYYQAYGFFGIFFSLLGVFLNFLLFIPFGYLIYSTNAMCVWKIVALGFAFSLFIEMAQLFLHFGMFETDDLIMNTLGTWVGTILYKKRINLPYL